MAEWQRPSGCSANECIEVRRWPKAVEIRNTNSINWLGGIVFVSPDEWRVFVAAIKNGEFDVPEL